ncbi:6087_t:CDS:2 [Funneliformis mosseae]|uniref:6087_t:CDS:1 n=1 Tax=Funneliformis mosseae TaxID=27381 RepID=A0A9N9BSB5_FUNMO|nr:6087_t:CDS:2 [Funneliformis mosseae]
MVYSFFVYVEVTQKFKIIEFEKYDQVGKAKLYDIKTDLFDGCKRYSKWMLAISNQIEQGVIFVAISCVTESDMLVRNDESNNLDKDNISEIKEIKIDECNFSESKPSSGKTVIYKIELNLKNEKDNNEPNIYKMENMGGVVLFVHDKSTHDNYCFIFNAGGIHRRTICDNILNGLEHFNYPRRLENELNNLRKTKSCISRIKNSVFDHYFYIEQYKEGVQVMQLYDLKTMQIRQIFNMHEDKQYSNEYSKPILAISKNEQIIAFSSGNGKLTLYLIENGLEIINKSFEKDTKIIACEFKDDDKLMIIIKTSQSQRGEMLLWDLFNSSKNRFRSICDGIELDEGNENPSYNAKIPGKFVSVTSNGTILSIYDSILEIKPKKDQILVSPYSTVFSTDKSQVGKPNEMIKSKCENVSIFHQGSTGIAQPLVHNCEPWDNQIFENKMWIYLDKEGSLQLYIGKNTIQVWRKTMKKNHKFALEYFWADNNDQLEVTKLIVYDNGFQLKWKETNVEFQIQWPFENHKIPIQHACDALEYLNDQSNHLIGYDNQHAFEEIKSNISAMIWKFIKNYPDIWRMMDIRYNLMNKIINSGSNPLIKHILFGDGKEKQYLHIPRTIRWVDSNNSESDLPKPDSDLQTAIKLCKPDIERNRRILIVTYLLEYYATKATEHPGWLITIPDALPYLYEFKLEHYVSELFYKRCMEGIEISNIIEYTDIIPKRYQVTLNTKQDLLAFNPISKLISTSKQKISPKVLGDNLELGLKKIWVKICTNEQLKYSPTVKMVPLYNFTVNNTSQKVESDKSSYIIKLFRLLFIPRSFKESHLLSPFVQIIRLEEDDEIFNNPVFHICNLFCGYLLIVELKQFIHYGWRHYFNLFNIVDLISVVIAIIVMSIYAAPSFSSKDAFANVVTTRRIAATITFTMLLLWFELILYLRLLSAGIAHSFLLLLQHPEFTELDQTENNPARNYIISFISTYNWLNGEFLQQDTWDIWQVKIITLFGSMLLITILQNMFIAFIWGVYAEAYTKGRSALLRFRAESISDYEALEQIYFDPPIPEPKYIYYLGKSKSYKDWDSKVRSRESENNKLYDYYEEKMIDTVLPYEDDEMKSDDNKGFENVEDNSDIKNKVTLLDNKVEDLKSVVNELNDKLDKLLNAIIK